MSRRKYWIQLQADDHPYEVFYVFVYGRRRLRDAIAWARRKIYADGYQELRVRGKLCVIRARRLTR